MSYKLNQTPVAGESYQRCFQVVIDNPLVGSPTVMFSQETIVGTDAATVLRIPTQPLAMPFDPAAEIAVINPETGEPTGATVTQAEVYALIFSAYIAAANPPPAILEEQP
ncbi:MAG: hypothetical protein ABFD96_25340 [Armatimonadia bacterium]